MAPLRGDGCGARRALGCDQEGVGRHYNPPIIKTWQPSGPLLPIYEQWNQWYQTKLSLGTHDPVFASLSSRGSWSASPEMLDYVQSFHTLAEMVFMLVVELQGL